MKKSNNIVLNRTKKTENFQSKVSMLDVDIDTQVEMLNTMYKGQVVFKKAVIDEDRWSSDESNQRYEIVIAKIAQNVISIELPECESLGIHNIVSYEAYMDVGSIRNFSLVTLKMPKCLKTLRIGDGSLWQKIVKRVFVWDTTNIEYVNKDRLHGDHTLDMLAVMSTTGGKNRVIKLSNKI